MEYSAKQPHRTAKKTSLRQVNSLARKHAPEALEAIVELMRDENAPWAVRVRAIEIILDRALGKPTTSADINVSGEVSIQHQHLLAVSEIAAARLAKLADGDDNKQDYADGKALVLEHVPGDDEDNPF